MSGRIEENERDPPAPPVTTKMAGGSSPFVVISLVSEASASRRGDEGVEELAATTETSFGSHESAGEQSDDSSSLRVGARDADMV